MAHLLLVLVLPIVPLVAAVLHAWPIKARIKYALASARSTIWMLLRAQASIVVTDLPTARRLLLRGSALSHRPPSFSPSATMSRRQHHNITSAPHGPLWRALRHNLTSNVIHPARLHQHAAAHRRALRGLVDDLAGQGRVVRAAESIRYAMFGLVATMCFGADAGLDKGRLRAWADRQGDLVNALPAALFFAQARFPALARLIHRNKWKNLASIRQKQEERYLPLIDSLRRRRRPSSSSSSQPTAYIDTLFDLQVPEDVASSKSRSLSDGELVGLCSEFLGTGTETTSAMLQWIMANLVKHPDVQDAVRREIRAAVAADAEEVSMDVLGKLEYLNAVIMETLRLHPPTSSVFRQVMDEDHAVHDGQRLPAGTKVFFTLAALARDGTVWDDPDEFKPQRFLAKEGSGSDDNVVKMMPFGAGRRMCPGKGIAMLRISYFAANLLREFEWSEPEGELPVDLEPKVEFFSVMKHPLRAHLELARQGTKG